MGDPPHRQNDRGQQIPADQGSWNGPPLEVRNKAIPGDIQVEVQDIGVSLFGEEVKPSNRYLWASEVGDLQACG